MANSFRRLDNAIPSSSPAFATPVHPIHARDRARPIPPPAFKPAVTTILPILLPPPALRPLAFRTFTKKHNLTLTSPALQALATFIGRHCGSGWREEGTAERVLDDVAKTWKNGGGALIVEDGVLLGNILKTLEGCMAGGRIVSTKSSLSRQSSFAFNDAATTPPPGAPTTPKLHHEGSSFGLSHLHVQPDDEDNDSQHPRAWLKVVSAYDQPRLTFDLNKKHFEKVVTPPSLLSSPAHRTALFRDRYNIIHQRLMRNEAFQAPAVNQRSLTRTDSVSTQNFYKITPIANLLGRNGSSHVLLGLLVVTPTGTLALNDLTGSITLDLQHAEAMRGNDSAWFCPGMIILVEGIYEEEYSGAGASGLGNTTGVGGTIGGKFIAFVISGPPSEKRALSLGITENKADDMTIGGGFGWTDFLGLGCEKVMGLKMRRLEQRLLAPSPSASSTDPSEDTPSGSHSDKRMVIMSEVNLDNPNALDALRTVLKHYSQESEAFPSSTPLSFILIGNFVAHPIMAGDGSGSGGSIDYKEYFNHLATVLADFPSLLRNSTWTFVPGDNDPWASAFSAGASTPIPRKEVPALFTSRVKRAFVAAKNEVGAKRDDGPEGEAIWTTNPTRVTLFGSAHEMVVFRDDMSGRFRRTAITFGKAAKQQQEQQQQEQQESTTHAHADAHADEAMQIDPSTAHDEAIEHSLESSMQLDNEPPPPPPPPNPTALARKLILSLLPQSTLSPFPLATRPAHCDYASALSLYPLPHTLVLADAQAPAFALTFEGCHVLNPGRLVTDEGKRARVRWIEYAVLEKRGTVKEVWM